MMDVYSMGGTILIEADRSLEAIRTDWQKHFNEQLCKSSAGKQVTGKQQYQLMTMLGIHISDHLYDLAQSESDAETKTGLMRASDAIWEFYYQHMLYVLTAFENKKPLKVVENLNEFSNDVINILNLISDSAAVVGKFQECYAVKLQNMEGIS